MKRFLTLMLVGLMFCATAFAASSSTVDNRDNPIGIGADITVVEFDSTFIDSVNIEVKRDVKNNETCGYLMFHVNLNKILNSLGSSTVVE